MNHPHNPIFLRFSKRAEASLHRLLRGVERSEDTGDSPSLQTISPDDLYRSLTALLLRILFLLYAEERALLPTDNPYYQNNHSLIGSVREEEPYAVYQRLKRLFHILFCGIEHPKLSIEPKGSPLFDPKTHPVLKRNIDNDTIRDVLSILKNHDDVPIDFKTLPIECIGSVYEHLLSFTLVRENSHFEITSKGERKKFGTHYTPPSLCNFIVEQTLGAAVRDLRTPSELLSLRVCDPAMGSGAFLLSACRFLYQFAQTQSPSLTTPSLRCRLAEQCLYGVDLNPTATHLAQLSLWLECAEPSQPFSFLSHNLRAGNSLIGARKHHLSSFSFTSETEHAQLPSPKRLPVLANWLVSLRYAIYFGGKNGKKRGKVDARNLVARETNAAKRYLYQQADVPPASQALMDQLPIAPFHWELAFPEVFCAPRKGFDAVIGNPPFVNCIRGNISDEVKILLKERYPDIRGSADLSYYFLYLASELTHKNSSIGLILPRVSMGASALTPFRSSPQHPKPRIIYSADHHRFFAGAAVKVVIYIFGVSNHCRVSQSDSPHDAVWNSIDLRYEDWWESYKHNWWGKFILGCRQIALPNTQNCYALRDLNFEVFAGLTTGDFYKIQAWNQKEGDGLKLLTSGAIDSNVCLWGKEKIAFRKQRIQYPRILDGAYAPSLERKLKRSRRPKIIVASLTRHVEAYFDKKGEYQGSTGTQTIFHKHDDCHMLRLLCTLLQTPRANQLFSIMLGYNAMHSSISMEKSFLETFPIPKAIWDPAQQTSPKRP